MSLPEIKELENTREALQLNFARLAELEQQLLDATCDHEIGMIADSLVHCETTILELDTKILVLENDLK